MDLSLIFIIVLLIVYSGYRDFLFQRERDRLESKLMSKSLEEYSLATNTKKEENAKNEEDPYLPIEEATIEQILKTKDKT